MRVRCSAFQLDCFRRAALWLLIFAAAWWAPAQQVTANSSQQLVFAGLRSVEAKGRINGIQADSVGNLLLAYDQGDGIRVLKLAAGTGSLAAEIHLGQAGDVARAIALDSSGRVYVTGTTTSGHLASTSGAAVPSPSALATSYVAGFDNNLGNTFVTFTGGSMAASAIAASDDSVFITGTISGSSLTASASAIGQAPASGSSQNGFVERFSSDGSTLVYATYITGTFGDTTPAGIAIDAGDGVHLAGATTAPGFPTTAAIVPEIISSPSGFLLRLTPAGDALVFSTFVPGSGLTSVSLDSTGLNVLASGTVALGQFPVETATAPLVPEPYQVLLRISADGSKFLSGTVVASGTQSVVTAGQNGDAWIAGEFSAYTIPWLPQPSFAKVGSAYAVRVDPANGIDQTIRIGGIPNQQQSYASLPADIASATVDPTGVLWIGGSVQPTASSSLLATETYDLALRPWATSEFASLLTDAKATAATCSGSLCAGSAALLEGYNTRASGASLSASVDDLPFITLRNLSSSALQGLSLSVTSGTFTSNCPATLATAAECTVLVSGETPGTLVTASSAGSQDEFAYGAYSATAPKSSIAVSPKELDFGVQTLSSAPRSMTFTLTNLGAVAESIATGVITLPRVASPFAEANSDCVAGPTIGSKTLAPGSSCHVTIAFSPSAGASDGYASGIWSVGSRQIPLTGYVQTASLSLSADELDFGTHYNGDTAYPRYLFLSNSSDAQQSHVTASLASGSPFTVDDECPSVLQPQSICRIRVDYLSSTIPSSDSATLSLGSGLTVLVRGKTIAASGVTGSTTAPALNLSPLTATFSEGVVVTGVSASTQTIAVNNPGPIDAPLSLSLSGDFIETTSCGTVLVAGASCAVAIQFAPATPGLRNGLLTVNAGTAGQALTAELSGTAEAILDGNMSRIGFGSVPVGQPATLFYKVTKPFAELSVSTIGPYQVTLVEDVGFGHGEPAPSSYVSSGTGSCRNCWVGVRYQPTATGLQNGTVVFSSAPQGHPFDVNLEGYGLATTGLILSPAAADFGAVPLSSTSGWQPFSLTNATDAPVSLLSATANSDFTLTQSAAAPCTGNLAPAASCLMHVSFNPMANGPDTGQLNIASSIGSVSAALSGTGAPPSVVAISPLSLIFENTGTSPANAQVVTVSNQSSANVQIGTPASGTQNFGLTSKCGLLSPGANCTIQVTFTPGQAEVQDALSIPVTFVDSSGVSQTNNYTVTLLGDYTASNAGLQLLPASMAFGPSATSTFGAIRQFTVTNTTAKSLALGTFVPQNFLLAGPQCTSLEAGASCSFLVQFAPLIAGDITGTISINAQATDGSLTLSNSTYADGYGMGAGTLAMSGALLVDGVYSFGQIAVGESASQTFTLTNNGPPGASLTVRRIASSPPFASKDTCNSLLGSGESCSVTVTYAPVSSTTTDAGTLRIDSDAQSSPLSITLNGQSSGTGSGSGRTLSTGYTLSEGALTFPATALGDVSPTQTVALTNSGSTLIHVITVAAPANFNVTSDCATLAAGDRCTIKVASTPLVLGSSLDALEIASDAQNALEFISLASSGSPSALTIAPASVAFGPLQVGRTVSASVVATNVSTAPIAFAAVTTNGPFTSTGDCPTGGGQLVPQASCTMQVLFAPLAAGNATGNLVFSTSASTNPRSVPLSGTGLSPQLTASPDTLAFDNLAIGSTATQAIVLSNSGQALISGIALSASGDFTVSSPCAATVLAGGATCEARITFQPSTVGARTGTLAITSSDPTSPLSIPLTGTGLPPPAFTLTVDGGSSSAATISSGQFASYALLVTPTGGFAGTVALTCTPVELVPFASCSLLPSQVVLSGSAASSATATINTVSSGTGVSAEIAPLWRRKGAALALALPAFCITLLRRRGRLNRLLGPAGGLLILICLAIAGCGGTSNLHVTAPGSYQFNVTATSTSGVQIAQTVSLTLTVNGP